MQLRSARLITRRAVIRNSCAAGAALHGRIAWPAQETRTVQAGLLTLELELDDSGLAVRRIANRGTRVEHLAQRSPLFGISLDGGKHWLRSDEGFEITESRPDSPNGKLAIRGKARSAPIVFTVIVTPQPQDNAALVKLELHNTGESRALCRVRVPWIAGVMLKGRKRAMMAALPQEAAGVVSTSDRSSIDLGMRMNAKIGLPNAMNTMEVLSLYDPDDYGGLFFADAEADLDTGAAPIQFTFRSGVICGHSLLDLEPGERRALPAFSAGVHETGDWHIAVDDYVRRHRAHWNFPDTPSWFREQGAIYSFSGSGGGAIYMMFPEQNLKSRIGSFKQLPMLLDEAQRLGTNILYLWDYWEGAAQGGRPAYWNKGDYIPRSDLGGASALREGIRRIHERGGRVILYVEPFIAFWYSHIGEANGAQWAGRDPNGELYHQYPQNYSMVSCFRPWQEYVTQVATRLVGDLGADGIFLDSWGWQLNWPMQTAEERVLYSPLDYSLGVLALAKQVRAAIRAVKPDAIVMGESTSGALGRYWDGGLSADFAWLGKQNQYRMLGAPVRYAMPTMNIFTNGRNRSELNQVFAAGYHLALLNANLPDASYIRTLVEIRQRYKDALIYGRQTFQPRTNNGAVTAYYYRGDTNEVITVSNSGEQDYQGRLLLDAAAADSRWKDLLHPALVSARGGTLNVRVPANALLVLARLDLKATTSS